MQYKLIKQLNLSVWTILSLLINYYKAYVQEAQTKTRDAKLQKTCNTIINPTTLIIDFTIHKMVFVSGQPHLPCCQVNTITCMSPNSQIRLLFSKR